MININACDEIIPAQTISIMQILYIYNVEFQ